MADSSTTTAQILNLIAGGCWARCRLHSGLKYVSVATNLRTSLPLVRAVFIDTLAIPELNGRFLHNHCTAPKSDCGRLLCLMPATQCYNISKKVVCIRNCSVASELGLCVLSVLCVLYQCATSGYVWCGQRPLPTLGSVRTPTTKQP